MYSRQSVDGVREMVVQDAEAQQEGVVLFTRPDHMHIHGWSPDERWLVYNDFQPTSRLFAVELGAPDRPLAVSEHSAFAHLSGDGRWLAFCTVDADGERIHVVSFPDLGRRSQVPGTGCYPKLNHDGTELYSMSSARLAGATVLQVSRRRAGSAEWSVPARLFDTWLGPFAVSETPRRFHVAEMNPAKLAREIRIVTAWRPDREAAAAK